MQLTSWIAVAVIVLTVAALVKKNGMSERRFYVLASFSAVPH